MEDNRNVYKSRYGTVKYRKMDRNDGRKGKLMIEVGILMREPKRKEERKRKRGERR